MHSMPAAAAPAASFKKFGTNLDASDLQNAVSFVGGLDKKRLNEQKKEETKAMKQQRKALAKEMRIVDQHSKLTRASTRMRLSRDRFVRGNYPNKFTICHKH